MVSEGETLNVQGAVMKIMVFFKSQWLQMLKNYKF